MIGKRLNAAKKTNVIGPAPVAGPKHVAIIMDGNGRWAQKKGKIRTFGHKAGVESVRSVVRFARQNAIESLTLFAKNGVRLQGIGDLSAFDTKLVDKIRKAEEMTKDNADLVLNIAANYGGRWDIVNAAQQLANQVKGGKLHASDIDEAMFTAHTSTANLPELDLLIRTGGEHRISNFLLWQCAYAELYFTDVLWPDFNEDVFQLAVDDFNLRQRRFGLTGEQVIVSDD